MNFEQYTPEANKFVKEIAIELGNPEDTDHAYRVMKAVLHTIRKIVTPEESLHLISQLPLILKGVYVDAWHIGGKKKIRSMDEFLHNLRVESDRSAARDFGSDETAKHNTKCVLAVLKRHIAKGEVNDLIDQFPIELTELWLTEAGTEGK